MQILTCVYSVNRFRWGFTEGFLEEVTDQRAEGRMDFEVVGSQGECWVTKTTVSEGERSQEDAVYVKPKEEYLCPETRVKVRVVKEWLLCWQGHSKLLQPPTQSGIPAVSRGMMKILLLLGRSGSNRRSMHPVRWWPQEREGQLRRGGHVATWPSVDFTTEGCAEHISHWWCI